MKKEETVYTRVELFIGIDVHKKQWSVSIYTSQIHHRTFSQLPSPEVLRCYIESHFSGAKVKCAYEATCFGWWIARKLESYGYECLVVNPSDIPTTSSEIQNKTDKIDSRKIAKTLQAGLLKGSYVPDEQLEGDRQLVRYRKRVWSDLVRIKNRIKGTLRFSGVDLPEEHDNAYWTKAFLRWLNEVSLPSKSTRITVDSLLYQYDQLYAHHLKVSREVRGLLKTVRYKERGKLLKGIPGIGPLTSIQLLVELGAIDRFPTFKSLNSFIGFKPTTYSSGEHDWKGHMTIRRHNALRSALIECSWQAVQKDPALLIKYEGLLKRMTKKRAIVVIARKLLSRIYHVLKHEEPYAIGLVA
ncbi:MAG: IS110 family transposase [Bacteroidota bacterium]